MTFHRRVDKVTPADALLSLNSPSTRLVDVRTSVSPSVHGHWARHMHGPPRLPEAFMRNDIDCVRTPIYLAGTNQKGRYPFRHQGSAGHRAAFALDGGETGLHPPLPPIPQFSCLAV